MLPDCLSAEGEHRCRRLLAPATARLRAWPAAAAVLVPLCSVRGVPALLYTLRSSRLAGRHKGDVSFPGGKRDPADQDVVHTALRETHEELGLVVPEDHVWGILQPVYDQNKTTIAPVLAGVGPLDPQSLKPNPEEVTSVRRTARRTASSEPNQAELSEQSRLPPRSPSVPSVMPPCPNSLGAAPSSPVCGAFSELPPHV
ncbi:nucleoside diphosphate-linked moiety X motif 8 isoform X2 [Pteropus vampyrus]|uniref:Nucleoside diphosphate-linked moiety X motif 8 isoform X2 n=1 Tax=Pteropus vampyrus TaxID=132908 RepID=A0A6P3RE59_PTEVA|nr:nucleoside diphosphate-linked moiety X motif 8 isoform X2 [Pteropus vampyrus]